MRFCENQGGIAKMERPLGAGLPGAGWGAASSLKGWLAFGKRSSGFADFNRVVTGSQYCLGYKCTWSLYFIRLSGLNNRNLSIVLVLSHSAVSNSVTPGTLAQKASLSMGFSRQEYWSELPFLCPGDLPHPGIEPGLFCIIGRFFTIWATREAL